MEDSNEIILESHDSLDEKLARGDGAGLESDEDLNNEVWAETIKEDIEQLEEAIEWEKHTIEKSIAHIAKNEVLLAKKKDLLKNPPNNF